MLQLKSIVYFYHYSHILFFVFKVIYSRVPTRADILGIGKLHDDNINTLTTQYLPALKSNLQRIDSLLKQYGLDSHKKV